MAVIDVTIKFDAEAAGVDPHTCNVENQLFNIIREALFEYCVHRCNPEAVGNADQYVRERYGCRSTFNGTAAFSDKFLADKRESVLLKCKIAKQLSAAHMTCCEGDSA